MVRPLSGSARQDKKARGREPITARLMADMFTTAGEDRLMAVGLHTDQIQGFFDGPVDHLQALPILADHVGAKYGEVCVGRCACGEVRDVSHVSVRGLHTRTCGFDARPRGRIE